MKKTLLVLVMIVLSLSLVFAGGKKETKKADDGKLEISVFSIQQRELPTADNKIYKWIENKFGVTFKWDILVGDKDQKIGVMIASGDLPDLVEVDSEKFQGAGCLIDLKPLVEQYCPNIMKHYESVWANMIDIDSDDDGTEHIYSLPNFGVYDVKEYTADYNQNGWWIQKEVLREYNYPVIKTIDEYFNLLEAYAKKYPTIDGLPTIPFLLLTDINEGFNLWNPPNFLAGYPNDGNGHVYWDAKQKKYIYENNFVDANAKKAYKLLNGYYNRGLIDPESFTDNKDQFVAKISQGRVLGSFIQGWEFMYDCQALFETQGKWERTYAPLPVTFDETVKPHYRDQSLPNLQRGYGITVNCGEEKAIKILKFLDAMLIEENSKILEWGIEGEDYFIDTDGSVTGTKGSPYRTAQQRADQADASWMLANKAQLFREETPKWEGYYSDGWPCSLDNVPYEFNQKQKAIDVELWKAYGVNNYAELVDLNPPKNAGWYPMWQCNPAPEKGGFEGEAGLAMNGFETIQRKLLPAAIMAKTDAEFEAVWADYVNQLGPLTAVFDEFMQGQLDHRVEAFGGFKD